MPKEGPHLDKRKEISSKKNTGSIRTPEKRRQAGGIPQAPQRSDIPYGASLPVQCWTLYPIEGVWVDAPSAMILGELCLSIVKVCLSEGI